MTSISKVAEAINEQATEHPFAQFLELRKRLQARTRLNSSIYNIKRKSVHERDGWAFHTGGSGELQFNIAFERAPELKKERFRYGVAFELKTNRNVPTIEPLLAKVNRFNHFIRENKDHFNDYRMWVWSGHHIIAPDTKVREITLDERKSPNFIVMGKTCAVESISVPQILDAFLELLPIYEFVEGTEEIETKHSRFDDLNQPFRFIPHLSLGSFESERSVVASVAKVDLTSNRIRELLIAKLRQDGHTQLGQEIASGNGGRIDIVSKLAEDEYNFYEIKPAESARQAIREALPQLLEYSYRQGGVLANKLFVVSQAEIDPKSDAFLEQLRQIGLPLFYIQIALI